MRVSTRSRRGSRLGAALVLVAGLLPAAAAERPAALGLEAYGPSDGLSQSTVTALAADDQGFLWIATQEGLNRFDGHGFRIFRRGAIADGGIASSSIDALAFDPATQRLWLGTNDAGLEVIHLPSGAKVRIGPEAGLSHTEVSHVVVDDSGAWLGTRLGVDRVDATLRTVARVGPVGAVAGLVREAPARALALGRDCRLWRLSRDDARPLATPSLGGSACIGLQQGDEGIWVATERDGVALFDSADGRMLRHLPMAVLQDGAAPVSALLRRRDGSVLVGFGDGTLSELAPGQPPRALPLDRTLQSAIITLHEDRGGSLWIGTYTSGLYQVRPLSAAIRNDLAGEDIADWPSRSLRALRHDRGAFLVGTDGGLMRRRDAGSPWTAVAAFAGHTVRVLEPATDGWWVGTHGGLWHWDGAGSSQPVDGLPDQRVEQVLVETDATWVATRGGLARIEAGRVVDDRRLAPLAGLLVTSLLRDHDGSLWIGTNADGIWRLADDGVPRRVVATRDALHESIWSLHATDEAVWAGSFTGGLFRLARGTHEVRAWTTRDGLGNNVVYRILEDAAGRLWLSTNHGLSVLDPATSIVQTLGPRDGLRNDEYNSGSAFRDADGLLHFGGTRGLDIIDPRGLPPRSAPAHPVLTTLRVMPHEGTAGGLPGERDLVYADDVVLGHADRVFSIAMTAIDFSAPDAARLRYRMRGLHDDWVYPGAAHAEFSMSHLPAGRYTLEVQAAGRDGQFGASRVLPVRMQPAWWRHPLAYGGYVALAMLLLAWLASRVGADLRRERQRVELLNRTVAERTAQLQDANRRLHHTNAQLDVAVRRDPLTRISNRRDLHDWLGREAAELRVQLEQEADGHERLVFFMIDIDDFKQVNDRHGHQAGDEVLVHFADRLRLLSRETDLLVRWGGEEFLLVSRFTRIADAALLAERVRETLARQPIRVRPGVALELTCSIGFAPWPFSLQFPAIGDWEGSVDLADRCLYAAKRGGKDAWVGLAPGRGCGQSTIESLLAGQPVDALDADCVQVVHRDGMQPRFER